MKIVRYVAGTLILSVAVLLFVAFNAATDPPAVGDTAPEFTLISNEGMEVSLDDYRDQWVVLYFYPRDFTRGCTIEARNFERDRELYEEKNAVILGVSVDSAESHEEFCAKEGLNFKLLSDSDAQVSTDYGSVIGIDKAKISARNTFVIDPEGVVASVFLKVKVQKHSEEVLAALDELQAD
ncbi:MAG: peroxiredoxin [Bacteroidetes bacterium]|nr:peroxiredoxin [Bacteroidota bacterium]